MDSETYHGNTESDYPNPNKMGPNQKLYPRRKREADPSPDPDRPHANGAEREKLDEFERLAKDAIIDENDGDSPGDSEEISKVLVVKKLPKFASFRTNPVTFDLWGTTDQQGMDECLYVTTKTFAPYFEEDVELRRVRFFETVTSDSVIRLVWCVVPEQKARDPNTWLTSKLAAMEHGENQWTTMRSRLKLQQWTFRPARKQDHPGPVFSGRSRAEWVAELKRLGMLIDSKDHSFYRRATDSE